MSSEQSSIHCPALLVPESAHIIIDSRAADEGKRMVLFESQASPEAMRAFYIDTLVSRGWEILLETEAGIQFGLRRTSGRTECEIEVVMNTEAGNTLKDVIVKEAGLNGK